jgi:hypothetical protein
MSDPTFDELERKERLFFARVVFAAKVITWAALLLLAAIIESALVIKVFQIEFLTHSVRPAVPGLLADPQGRCNTAAPTPRP